MNFQLTRSSLKPIIFDALAFLSWVFTSAILLSWLFHLNRVGLEQQLEFVRNPLLNSSLVFLSSVFMFVALVVFSTLPKKAEKINPTKIAVGVTCAVFLLMPLSLSKDVTTLSLVLEYAIKGLMRVEGSYPLSWIHF